MVIRRLLLVLLAAALLASPAGAATRIVRGMRAAPIDARGVDGSTPVALEDWRGRMLLLVFFGTSCPHCKASVARLDEIARRHGDAGVDVLGVSPDPAKAIARFAAEQRAAHGLAQVPKDALRAYGVTTYPHALLIGPHGRVLWQGTPKRLSDRVLTAYLAHVRIAPEAPAAFAAVEADRRAGRYGAVAQALERQRACRRLDRASCRYVLDTLAWVAWHQEASLAAAADDEVRGRWAAAVRTYDELRAAYPDTTTAKTAAARRTRILADEARARAVAGWHALEEARRAGRWKPLETQRALLERMAAAHPGTEAAAEARALLEALAP